MKTELLAIAAMATELQDTGAVRSEHNPKWQQLRIAIDQAADLADDPVRADPVQVQLERIAADVALIREAAAL